MAKGASIHKPFLLCNTCSGIPIGTLGEGPERPRVDPLPLQGFVTHAQFIVMWPSPGIGAFLPRRGPPQTLTNREQSGSSAISCRIEGWMRFLAASVCTICALCLLPSSGRPAGAGNPDIAALQVALRAADAYVGPVDGWRGPETDEALLAFQQRKGLEPDGIVGPRRATLSDASDDRSSGCAHSSPVRAAGTSPSSSSTSPGTASRQGPSTAPSARAWRSWCAASSVSPTCRASVSPGQERSPPCVTLCPRARSI